MNLERLKPSPFSNAEWESEIKAQCAYLLRGCRPFAIYVFGSALSEENRRAASDLDLGVVVYRSEDRKALAPVIAEMKIASSIPLDIVVFTRAEFEASAHRGALAEVIARTGKLVFKGGA